MYSTSISKIMKREWTLEIIEVEQENRPDPEYFKSAKLALWSAGSGRNKDFFLKLSLP